MRRNDEFFLEQLLSRYPILSSSEDSILNCYIVLRNCFESGGKLLIAGNGGSAADAGHIVGELMKGFRLNRVISEGLANKLKTIDMNQGTALSKHLQQALPAISLVNNSELISAFLNDVGDEEIFAQQILGYGKSGDVFLGISTSGNSRNIIAAAITAKAMDLKIVALTGNGGGRLSRYADVLVDVPEKETYKVQELHLPIYHCICLMLEDYFFGEESELITEGVDKYLK